MSQCNPNILVEGKYFNIAQCSCCKRIGLHYRNLMVGFRCQDFKAWAQSVLQVDFAQSASLFPDGETRLILMTCHKDIQFTFTEKEFEEIRGALSQSLLLLELHELLQDRKN